jgi:sugar transferase EpsL
MVMYPVIKRALDFMLALILLVVLFPLVVLVGILIFTLDGRPIFFRQVRPGLGGKPFVMVKFRTMSEAPVGANGDESARVTKLGAILRKSSIDEIPSLWNVLRGDLSFVGPRPLLMDYLEIYSPGHSERHAVRPGLTGLAQIAGRNLVSWNERLDFDVVYVQQQSLLLDIKILLRTIFVVVSFRGIDQADGSTMVRLTKGYDTE